MQPHSDFADQSKEFWADVRTLSQKLGYSRRGVFVVPTARDIVVGYQQLGLDPFHLVDGRQLTGYGDTVTSYLHYRAEVLTNRVQHQLMDADQVRTLYDEVRARNPQSRAPQPMNKQKGAMRAPAYLTCLVNMLIEANIGGLPCDYDPRELTAVTRDARPVRTLARRVDGAFPSATNPVALWEIKEYYYTTTFGSRIADGVYETLLDGMELEELHEHTGVKVLHYLIVDAYDTWWNDGKSYLCRMVDMLHMGYVDEVLFGREVVERIPVLADYWLQLTP
ncbi:MAG: DUF7687 domain-containing protein [Acidimicrobiales bacterium]